MKPIFLAFTFSDVIQDIANDYFFRLVVAFVAFSFFIIAGRLIRPFLLRSIERRVRDNEAATFLANSFRFANIFVGAMVGLAILQLNTLIAFFLGLGVVFVILMSIMFNDLPANFYAGFWINTKGVFRVGDLIKTGNTEGRVQRISIQSTTLETFSGTLIHVPNRIFFQKGIENLSRIGKRQIELSVPVYLPANLKQIQNIVAQHISQLEFVLRNPGIKIDYDNFNSGKVDLIVRFWVHRLDTHPQYAKTETIKEINDLFQKRGILTSSDLNTTHPQEKPEAVYVAQK